MLKIKGIKLFLLVLFGLLFAFSYSYAGGIPPYINYNGSLAKADGSPVPDGQYAVVFSIYSAQSNGTPLWTEMWNASNEPIITVGGNFNVMLGKHTPLLSSFFVDHTETYLGIKVGNDPEMLPRQRIVSVGYAFTSGTAWNGVPKGGIIMWSGAEDQIPDGWALCDGSNGTPNLRDRFVVGAGNGYGVGTTGGEATHVLTIAEMPSHTHSQDPHNHGITDPGHTHSYTAENGDGKNKMRAGTNGDGTYGPYSYSILANTTGISVNNATATNQNAGGGAAHENRPPYYALAFIMKL